jgi:hypothetical protein
MTAAAYSYLEELDELKGVARWKERNRFKPSSPPPA